MKEYFSKVVIILIFSATILLIFSGCQKKNAVFTMKAVKLNFYEKEHFPEQDIFIKVVNNDSTLLACTEKYNSLYTLPVTFGISPGLKVQLYKEKPVSIQLWGDSSGCMASYPVHIEEYTILFPLEMEIGDEQINLSVIGTWAK